MESPVINLHMKGYLFYEKRWVACSGARIVCSIRGAVSPDKVLHDIYGPTNTETDNKWVANVIVKYKTKAYKSHRVHL